MSEPEHPAAKVHPALHRMVQVVLAYKPKPKSKPAKKRARKSKKLKSAANR